MEETGQVISVKENIAEVVIERKAACKSCGACRMISDSEMMIEAENPAGAVPGDRVTIYLSEEKALKASATVYLIPLLGFFAGYFAGAWLSGMLGLPGGEAAAIILAFAALAASFLGVKAYFASSKEAARSYLPRIVRIVNS